MRWPSIITGLRGCSADRRTHQPSGFSGTSDHRENFSTKRWTQSTRRITPSIFSRFQRDFRGALFHLRKDSFLADFLFVCQRLALLQKLVNPNRFVLLRMCQTGGGQKIWQKTMCGKLSIIWHSLQRQTYLSVHVGGLGKEDRILVKGGVYISQHQISIPKELATLWFLIFYLPDFDFLFIRM